ncbi:MAG: hypothetical protein IJU37_12540 [Desulfovibrio sp.]|nr:hypothetical protein [Desulfovibrio sp.]
MIFSGSYSPQDIVFLLQPADIPLTCLETKERLLQSGQKHYSDMLSEERPPSEEHMRIYHSAMQRGAARLALETLALASAIARRHQTTATITLASIARAGCPLGVLLKRALRSMGYADVRHFGISVIRDRGVDKAAMTEIGKMAPGQNLYFVDGWTGKGAIAQELRRSLCAAPCTLVVLSDLCGQADVAASQEDWLIPFGILGAAISGLISRTVWSDQGLHRCRLWKELQPWDISQKFADEVSALWTPAMLSKARQLPCESSAESKIAARRRTEALVGRIMRDYGISSRNRIKPGIAEATRALLRRVPEVVFVRNLDDPDLELLLHLAAKNSVQVRSQGDAIAPYKAVTVIKKADFH